MPNQEKVILLDEMGGCKIRVAAMADQIMSLIPERDFKTCVDRYKGNYRARNFSCKDQFHR